MTSSESQTDLLSTEVLELTTSNDDIKAKWPKVLIEYVEVIRRVFESDGKDKAEASRLAYAAVIALAKQRGGQIEYLPKGTALATAIKHKAIWDEFDGKNTEALADKFDINRIDIYKIIRQQRALHTKKVQGSLF